MAAASSRRLVVAVLSVLWAPVLLLGVVVCLPAGRFITSRRRRRALPPRIVWGTYALPQTVYMAEADRRQGYDSRVLIWYPSYYNRDWEVPAHVRRFARTYRALVLPRYLGFLWSLLKFDIFQYAFANQQLSDTAAESVELPLLRLAGKRVIVSPYGADVMVPGMRAWCDRDFYDLVVRDYPQMGTAAWRRRVQRRIRRAIRHADRIVAFVPYLDVLPRVDVKRHYWAIDLEEWLPGEPPRRERLLVVHASNHRHNKGTNIIIEVCRALEAEGCPIEFRLLEGVPRDEAKRIYGSADIVIEQLFAGIFGMFGVESMAMARPTLVYLREDILEHHPEFADCPAVNVNPQTLRQRLRDLVGDADLRLRLGRAGREFVRRHYGLDAIGGFSAGLYRSLWT